MAAYYLERLRILVVDDNAFTRNLLTDILKTFGVGEVIKAADGAQAVSVLRHGVRGEIRHIDIVITDVYMPSISGIRLVQWIRQSQHSPNRFMPVIMMSGAADDESVGHARDSGANEFLAKPFSPGSVSERLFALIDRPRQFVAAANYFGPDRKRRKDSDVEIDRRETDDSDANVIYSPDMIVRPKEPGEIYFFRLPNGLREKVGGGPGDAGALPPAILEEADRVVGETAEDFRGWILDYIGSISKLCDAASERPIKHRTRFFGQVHDLAHELRGQGGMFGFPIITAVGEMLYAITGEGCDMGDRSIDLVRAHLDTMHRVFLDRIEGDGGDVGQELVRELRVRVERSVAKVGKDEPPA